MARDESVGAVCARTHPLGSGLLVWLQIFEYAIGHWFQKVCKSLFSLCLLELSCHLSYHKTLQFRNKYLWNKSKEGSSIRCFKNFSIIKIQFRRNINCLKFQASEHVLGTVLCAPGCFSVYRLKAINDVLSLYATNVEKAEEFLTKDMGEDRWLCTLLVKSLSTSLENFMLYLCNY
jgi:hypothetical protein